MFSTVAKKYLFAAMLITLLSSTVALALSNDVKLDIASDKLAKAMEVDDDAMIIEAIQSLRDLMAIGFIESDSRLDFIEGKAYFQMRNYLKAMPLLESYIEAEGRKGEYYREAISMYGDLETSIQSQVDEDLKKIRYPNIANSEQEALERIEKLLTYEKRSAKATELLAMIYFQGINHQNNYNYAKPQLVKPSPTKARAYLERVQNAAILDYKFYLAEMYRYGLGGEQDIDRAIEIFLSLVSSPPNKNNNNEIISLRSKQALFSIYAFGEGGITPDIEKAKSIATFEELSFDIIGRLYEEGLGYPQNLKAAGSAYWRWGTGQYMSTNRWQNWERKAFYEGLPSDFIRLIKKEAPVCYNGTLGKSDKNKLCKILGGERQIQNKKRRKKFNLAGVQYSTVVHRTGYKHDGTWDNYETPYIIRTENPDVSDGINVVNGHLWLRARKIAGEMALAHADKMQGEGKRDIAAKYYKLSSHFGVESATEKTTEIEKSKAEEQTRTEILAPLISSKRTFKYSAKGKGITAVAMDAKGKHVAAADDYKKTRLLIWDRASGKLLESHKTTGWVNKIAYSPNGDWLVTAGNHRNGVEIEAWNINDDYDDEYDLTLKGYSKIVHLGFSTGGASLIVVGKHSVASYSMPKLKQIWRKTYKSDLYDADISADGTRLALSIGLNQPALQVLDTGNGKSIWGKGFDGTYHGTSFLGESHQVLVKVNKNGSLYRVFDRTGKLIVQRELPKDIYHNKSERSYSLRGTEDLFVDPTGNWFVTLATTDGQELTLYFDTKTLALIKAKAAGGNNFLEVGNKSSVILGNRGWFNVREISDLPPNLFGTPNQELPNKVSMLQPPDNESIGLLSPESKITATTSSTTTDEINCLSNAIPLSFSRYEENKLPAPGVTQHAAQCWYGEKTHIRVLGNYLSGDTTAACSNPQTNRRANPMIQQMVAMGMGADVLKQVQVMPTMEIKAFGIVFVPSSDGKSVFIDAVLSGSHAEKAGVKRMDRVTEINGDAAFAVSPQVALGYLSNESKVKLTIMRKTNPNAQTEEKLKIKVKKKKFMPPQNILIFAEPSLASVILELPYKSGKQEDYQEWIEFGQEFLKTYSNKAIQCP